MAQCPFASELLKELLPVIRRLGPSVQLQFDFVGTPVEGGWSSAHGAGEMLAEKLMLCAEAVAGEGPALEFLQCQLDQTELPPSGWQHCAEQSGLDGKSLASCAFEARGNELLEKSYASADRRKATSSPSLFIAGRRYDGGRSGAFLLRSLCAAMTVPHPYCAAAPQPPAGRVTLLVDRRCTDPECDPNVAEHFVLSTFAGATVHQVDWSSPEGRALVTTAGITRLPAFVLDPDLQKDEWGFSRVRSAVRESNLGFVLATSSAWDPVQGRHVEPDANGPASSVAATH
jgi:hypothetical protein